MSHLALHSSFMFTLLAGDLGAKRHVGSLSSLEDGAMLHEHLPFTCLTVARLVSQASLPSLEIQPN